MKRQIFLFFLTLSIDLNAVEMTEARSFFQPDYEIDQILIHPDGFRVAVLAKGKIYSYDLKSGTLMWARGLAPYSRIASSGALAYSENGDELLHGFLLNKYRGIRTVDGLTGKVTRYSHMLPNDGGPYTTMAFSADRRLAISGNWISPQLEIWNLESQKVIKVLKGGGKMVKVGFSPSGELAYAISDQAIAIWNLSALKIIRYLNMRDLFGPSYGTHGAYRSGPSMRRIQGAEFFLGLNYVALHTCEDWAANTGKEKCEIFVINLLNSKTIHRFDFDGLAFVRKLAFSQSGEKLMALVTESYFKNQKSKIFVWDLASGNLDSEGVGPTLASLAGSRAPLRPYIQISFSQDKSLMAAKRGGYIKIYTVSGFD